MARFALVTLLLLLVVPWSAHATSAAQSATLRVTTFNCVTDMHAVPRISVLQMNNRGLPHFFLHGPVGIEKQQFGSRQHLSPGVDRFTLKLTPGNYEIYAQSRWCSGQVMALVLARHIRSTSIALQQFPAFNMLFDHDHVSVAGTIPIPGFDVLVRDVEDPTWDQHPSVEGDTFFFDSLQRKNWILEFRSGSAVVAQFPLALGTLEPGDYATLSLTPADVLQRSGYHGSMFSDPFDIAVDSQNEIWYSNPDRHTIGFVSPQLAAREFPIPSGASPQYIAIAGDENVWFTERGVPRIGRINLSGVVKEFDVPAEKGRVFQQPSSLKGAVDGSAWAVAPSGSAVIRVRPNGLVDQFDASALTQRIDAITVDDDGAVWFVANDKSNRKMIARVSAAGLRSYSLGKAIRLDAASNAISHTLYYFDRVGNDEGHEALKRLEIFGGGSNAALLINNGDSSVVTADGSGGTWVADCRSDRITYTSADGNQRTTVLEKGACPDRIIPDSSGGAWFVEARVNRLGHLDASGKMVTHSFGPTVRLVQLIRASDGTIWFAEAGANAIGYVREDRFESVDLRNPGATPHMQIIP